MNYYYLEVGVRTGELEFTVPSVCALKGKGAALFLEERAKTFYGGEPFLQDGEWYFNGGEHCTYSNTVRTITKKEFDVLKNFMCFYTEGKIEESTEVDTGEDEKKFAKALKKADDILCADGYEDLQSQVNAIQEEFKTNPSGMIDHIDSYDVVPCEKFQYTFTNRDFLAHIGLIEK